MFESVTFWSSFAVGFAAFGGFILTKSFVRVGEGHLGVVMSFGRALFQPSAGNHAHLKTLKPGLHRKLPWQKVIEVSVMERVLDLSGKEGGTLAMAADGTLLRLDSKLRYVPQVQDLYSYLFTLKRPMEHIKGLFACLLRNEIANFEGELATQETKVIDDKAKAYLQATSYAVIRSERRLLNQKLQDFCHSQLDGKYGVQFQAVDLTDILPPDELGDALNAVINAQTEGEARYARAEGECRQRVMAAEKGVAIAKANAAATAEEVEGTAAVLETLQRGGMLFEYLERRRAEVFADSRAVFARRPS